MTCCLHCHAQPVAGILILYLLLAQARGLPGEIVRASVHYYNTEDEVARLVSAVALLANQKGTSEGAGSFAD